MISAEQKLLTQKKSLGSGQVFWEPSGLLNLGLAWRIHRNFAVFFQSTKGTLVSRAKPFFWLCTAKGLPW